MVPASYAQFGVGAEGRCIICACGRRAIFNGMEVPTLLLWRPVIVQRRTPRVVSDFCTKQDVNLQCGVKTTVKRCVQSSLPCVSSAGSRCQAYRPLAGGEV